MTGCEELHPIAVAGLPRTRADDGHDRAVARCAVWSAPHAGYLMDQAWHKGWIALAAAVAASGKD